MFLRGEYNESNEFFSVNENDLGSLLNLEDMHGRKVPSIGHSS